MSRRRQWHPTPVLLPGKSHGWRSLVGCSPWGREESDTTERLPFHFSLSCIGEGNDNPLQCSCLENPRDGGAWWAAVYGVTQSRTRLKWLSSSSRKMSKGNEFTFSPIEFHRYRRQWSPAWIEELDRCVHISWFHYLPAPWPWIAGLSPVSLSWPLILCWVLSQVLPHTCEQQRPKHLFCYRWWSDADRILDGEKCQGKEDWEKQRCPRAGWPSSPPQDVH